MTQSDYICNPSNEKLEECVPLKKAWRLFKDGDGVRRDRKGGMRVRERERAVLLSGCRVIRSTWKKCCHCRRQTQGRWVSQADISSFHMTEHGELFEYKLLKPNKFFTHETL